MFYTCHLLQAIIQNENSCLLYCFLLSQDFEVNMPVHELDMKTTRVKEIDGKLDMRAPPDQRFT